MNSCASSVPLMRRMAASPLFTVLQESKYFYSSGSKAAQTSRMSRTSTCSSCHVLVTDNLNFINIGTHVTFCFVASLQNSVLCPDDQAE